jgi:hypothetical protein
MLVSFAVLESHPLSNVMPITIHSFFSVYELFSRLSCYPYVFCNISKFESFSHVRIYFVLLLWSPVAILSNKYALPFNNWDFFGLKYKFYYLRMFLLMWYYVGVILSSNFTICQALFFSPSLCDF